MTNRSMRKKMKTIGRRQKRRSDTPSLPFSLVGSPFSSPLSYRHCPRPPRLPPPPRLCSAGPDALLARLARGRRFPVRHQLLGGLPLLDTRGGVPLVHPVHDLPAVKAEGPPLANRRQKAQDADKRTENAVCHNCLKRQGSISNPEYPDLVQRGRHHPDRSASAFGGRRPHPGVERGMAVPTQFFSVPGRIYAPVNNPSSDRDM
jgi:hypothetical protein